MADNSQINNGTGDYIRGKDRAGIKTQIVGIDIGIGGSESLMSSTNPMPVQNASLTGSVAATVVTVGTSAVALPSSALSNRRTITVQSDVTNSAYIYLGGSGVTADATSTGGLVLTAGQSISLDIGSATLYARSTVASQSVRVFEVS